MSNEYPTIGRARRMEQKAVSLGWVIPDEVKADVVGEQVKIATDKSGEASNREKTSAAKCLASMNAQNIAIAVSSNINEESDKLTPVSPAAMLVEMRKTIPSK